QSFGDGMNIRLFSPELRGRVPCDHTQAGNAGEGVYQLLRETVAEVLIAAIGTEIGEGQHGDGARMGSSGRRLHFVRRRGAGAEDRRVGALFEADNDVVFAAVILVVRAEFVAEPPRLHADDWIDARIVVVLAIEDV